MFKFLKDKLKGAISKIKESVKDADEVGKQSVEQSPETPEQDISKSEAQHASKSQDEEKQTEAREESNPEEELKHKETIPKKTIETIKAIEATESSLSGSEKEKTQAQVIHKIKEDTILQKEEEKSSAGKKYAENLKSSQLTEEPEELSASPNKKGFFSKIKESISKKKKEETKSAKRAESAEREQAEPEQSKREAETKSAETKSAEPKPEESSSKGFFSKVKEAITTTKISREKFEELFWDIEMALMENNVAVEVIEKIKTDLSSEIVDKPISRAGIEKTIESTLKNSILELFDAAGMDILLEIKNKKEKPYVIAFFGINGSGKTTSIAKMARMLSKNKLSCVIAAADTFRAASIEQLAHHGEKLGVKVIKHDYGSDPAAVAFDAIKHAKSKNIDVVLIDTAGRMHSNKNLAEEMTKIVRVSKSDIKIFVGESITGNDCVEQAKTFNEAIGIDGIILSKVDIDEKGGAAVSVSYVTKKPIIYLGTGQEYDDLKSFDSEIIIKNLGLA